jgi:hypothetical protein
MNALEKVDTCEHIHYVIDDDVVCVDCGKVLDLHPTPYQ